MHYTTAQEAHEKEAGIRSVNPKTKQTPYPQTLYSKQHTHKLSQFSHST
jgi:hypothetical protein